MPREDAPLTVGQVAKLAHVSVRTLHHYDELGLLSPGQRSEAGYRLYTREDLERLHAVLAYRELGFELDVIGELVADPNIDAVEHLRHQEAVLNARLEKLLAMRRSLRRQMEARNMGINLNPQEILEVFGDQDPTEYAAEAEERWGDTDAYQESQRRTKRYTKDDWKRIGADFEAIATRFAELLRSGVDPTDPAALEVAEAHRQHISKNFYDCSYPMHRGLAEMYLADERFADNYEKRAQGLTAFVSAAIVANAESRERAEGYTGPQGRSRPSR